MSEIKIEMLTERVALRVRPSYLRDSPSRVYVDVCLTCGALVGDPVKHDLWHRQNRTMTNYRLDASNIQTTHHKGELDLDLDLNGGGSSKRSIQITLSPDEALTLAVKIIQGLTLLNGSDQPSGLIAPHSSDE